MIHESDKTQPGVVVVGICSDDDARKLAEMFESGELNGTVVVSYSTDTSSTFEEEPFELAVSEAIEEIDLSVYYEKDLNIEQNRGIIKQVNDSYRIPKVPVKGKHKK